MSGKVRRINPANNVLVLLDPSKPEDAALLHAWDTWGDEIAAGRRAREVAELKAARR